MLGIRRYRMKEVKVNMQEEERKRKHVMNYGDLPAIFAHRLKR